jgi:hypothetical protein
MVTLQYLITPTQPLPISPIPHASVRGKLKAQGTPYPRPSTGKIRVCITPHTLHLPPVGPQTPHPRLCRCFI